MAEWVKAAEVQLELHRWLTSGTGRGWVRGWIGAEKHNEPMKGDMYDLLARVEEQKLLTADAIWVAPEISDVIDVARQSFRPEAMEREDFITHTGFCYFDRPLYMLDRNYKKVSVGAISWCPVVFKREGTDPLGEEVLKEQVGKGGHGSVVGIDVPDSTEDKWGMCVAIYSSAKAVDDAYSHRHRQAMQEGRACELIPLHYTTITFGDTLDDGEMLDEHGAYTGADEWWQLIQTSLRLMQQRVAVKDDGPLPRATRKRQQRAGVGVSEVLVIRLRRPASKAGDENGSSVEWTHRWLVDGHWRNQWYPSLLRHRQVWISPYVKGPEDKELVIKRRYYKWDR